MNLSEEIIRWHASEYPEVRKEGQKYHLLMLLNNFDLLQTVARKNQLGIITHLNRALAANA